MNIRAIETGCPPKIPITKIGFDGHDRGSRIVATLLRDAGMEVVYTGPWQTVANVVNLALQEVVEVFSISSLAMGHFILPKLVTALRDFGLGNIFDGIVPDGETELLTSPAGGAYIFHPGAASGEIVSTISALAVPVRANVNCKGLFPCPIQL